MELILHSVLLLTRTATPAVFARGKRRLSVGAEYTGDGHAHFRVWAPSASRVDVVIEPDRRRHLLEDEGGGFFSGTVSARPGDDYWFSLDGRDRLLPDPASRFQPAGPHGPSRIVAPGAFAWTDAEWSGAQLEGQVIYELHVGTFTREGTWEAATGRLAELADLGITVIEPMPIAEFEGRFGWGYDGVDLYAPYHGYGTPDDLRRFVDRAHATGLAVILDVVYNHLGPVGNYLREFSPAYFTDRYENEWGDAINFDGPEAQPVRDFFVQNAAYWIDEYHMDGVRLDATQQIFDASPEHVVAAIGKSVRRAAGPRSTILVAENEPQDTRLVRPLAANGYGLDALWNDDFHHSAMVALTGKGEAYYSDTRGDAQEFISAAKYGYLFQGQHYEWQRKPRGTPGLDVPPARYVTYLQNHDQVANSATGERGHLLTSRGKWRAMTALLLLMPGTPMLFQGQEFCASTPFLYFADFEGDLATAVRKGRAEFLTQFPSIVHFAATRRFDDPGDPRTFERCKLDAGDRREDAWLLHRDLLRLRRESPAFRRQRAHAVDGAVLGERAFVLRFFAATHDEDRLLVVNLGADLHRASIADPLVAPPMGRSWRVEWSSEDPAYGGRGTPDLWPDARWLIPGECACVLSPEPAPESIPPQVKRRTA